MHDLSEECLRILNNGLFEITEAGPLHQPIRRFSIKRDEKLHLILETEADGDATSLAINHPPGTLLFNTERSVLKSHDGEEAEFIGVIPYRVIGHHLGGPEAKKNELAKIHIAKTNRPSAAEPAYIIDWLENLPRSPYVWPTASDITERTVITRRFERDGGLVMLKERGKNSGSRTSAKLTVEGTTFYVCALENNDSATAIKPGCIVYEGVPDEIFRKKIRIGLSFALGLYLVDLGSTHYDANWQIVSSVARDAYSLGHHAFEIQNLQLAPLGPKFQYQITIEQLTHAVEAYVKNFDSLDLANLHWAYWHACAATPHISPAHFGAAIEGLQTAYAKSNPKKVRKGWASEQKWKALKNALSATIDQAGIPDEIKARFKDKLPTFNGIDQRQRLKDIMATLNLQLSDDEDRAWRRRNKAAHGTPIAEGQEAEAIRDMKLLRGLFQRLLLRITGASVQYIDYASPHHNYRDLHEAPPNVSVEP